MLLSRSRHLVAGVFTALVVIASGCSDSNESSDEPSSDSNSRLVIRNAAIFTADSNDSMAEGLIVEDGIITSIGTDSEIEALTKDGDQVIDANGGSVLPGFQDAHVHALEAGIFESLWCFVEPGQADIQAYAQQVAECAATQPNEPWVRVSGVPIYELQGSEITPLEALDNAVPDRPVVLLDDLGHGAMANSLALKEAGVTADSEDPRGGILHRDEAGNLTGLLLEDAQQLVRDPAKQDVDTISAGLEVGISELSRNGITTISDAGGYWTRDHDKAWGSGEGQAVRARNCLYVFADRDFDQQIEDLKERYSNNTDDKVNFNCAKIYVDGILALGTAATSEPYLELLNPELPNGFLYFGEDDLLDRYVEELHNIGFQINFHAIGDDAIRRALDSIENLGEDPEVANRHHRITHTYLINSVDVPRFAELGVVADFQLNPGSVNQEYVDFVSQSVSATLRPIQPRSVLDAGGLVTFSSDWDAGPLPPLGTLQRAVNREPRSESLTLKEAIRAHTISTAVLLGDDERTGSIEVGKLADLVVLDKDIFSVDSKEIENLRVERTFLEGQQTYPSS